MQSVGDSSAVPLAVLVAFALLMSSAFAMVLAVRTYDDYSLAVVAIVTIGACRAADAGQ
jgi:hypothetical protein